MLCENLSLFQSVCSNAVDMHLAAILGPGNTGKTFAAFQRKANARWTSLVEQADAIVIFGGDGTIHRNLPKLIELDVPVLIVPCGSGNDFARALGLRSIRDSLTAWQQFSTGQSKPRLVDLGLIRQSAQRDSGSDFQVYFCCVAGVGLDTEIAKRANLLPRWLRARGGYGLSAPREFFRFAPFPMKISPDGSSPSGFHPTILAAVANTQYYGGGMRIAPGALLDDGKLDICVVRAMDKFKLFCLFPTVYFGRHTKISSVEYAQAPVAAIETERPFDVYADGEYICQTPVEFSVAPGALQVIVAQ